jgi:hypothetical protein
MDPVDHQKDAPDTGSGRAEPTAAPEPATPHSADARLRVGGVDLLNVMAAVLAAAVITIGVLYARGSSPAAAEPPSPAAAAPATAVAAATVVMPGPTTPGWSGEGADRWTGGVRRSYAFDVASRQDVGVWMRTVRPRLVVRCTAGEVDAFVFTDSAAAIEPETADHTVRYRFDADPEMVERWADSSEHDGLFAPLGASFVERLKGAQTFTFAYTPHNAPPVTMHFDVRGLREVLEPVEKGCVTPRRRGRPASAGRP